MMDNEADEREHAAITRPFSKRTPNTEGPAKHYTQPQTQPAQLSGIEDEAKDQRSVYPHQDYWLQKNP
jgi:hypothetical protein